ncbi:hypothetical protein BJV82DRAFT_674124 [Fennellomyces sp. T-0311]|nr:hypothetical protein BJV82DRAFT_674124 [Fennellomyces sp. T-0311]
MVITKLSTAVILLLLACFAQQAVIAQDEGGDVECTDEGPCTTSSPSPSDVSTAGLPSTMIATETPTPSNPYSSGNFNRPLSATPNTILLVSSIILYLNSL